MEKSGQFVEDALATCKYCCVYPYTVVACTVHVVCAPDQPMSLGVMEWNRIFSFVQQDTNKILLCVLFTFFFVSVRAGDPPTDVNAQGDAFKTLFVGRIVSVTPVLSN